MSSTSRSTNAKVGAVAMAVGAFGILLLTHASASLAPLRLLSIALSAFAAWCFCDEMGMHKPLNRGGFVLFAIAVAAKVERTVGVSSHDVARFSLLYGAFLLAAIVFWSIAFLHRQKRVKVVGAIGLVAALAPIVLLIVGHVAVGAVAFFGLGTMLTHPGDPAFVTICERLFGLWCYAAAWLLWRGEIANPAKIPA